MSHQRATKDLTPTIHQIVAWLDKQAVVKGLAKRQFQHNSEMMQTLASRQLNTHLYNKLRKLHPADIAFILESLPLEQRHQVWAVIDVERYGAILLEVSEVVRNSLIAATPHREMVQATGHLDSDEIADLLTSLPKDMVFDVMVSLDHRNRAEVQSALTFPEDSVGALMDFDNITVREDMVLDAVVAWLRQRGELPAHIDQLFVLDTEGVLQGVLPLKNLLCRDGNTLVKDVMSTQPHVFHTDDAARDAVQAFERYDLRSAPVVNLHQQVVGCLSVDNVMRYFNGYMQRERLQQAGLVEEEDLFSSVWKSAQNRWLWLAINLCSAFIASTVIGQFETTIAQLVALATLMPIVASIGGNTGNQTVALIVRGLALNQINQAHIMHLVRKELSISLVNGALWGCVVAGFAFVLYRDFALSLVMMVALMLNLLIASLVGVFIPLGLHKFKQDPAMGSSVMLTAMTDSMGFFIFLGLATVFLL